MDSASQPKEHRGAGVSGEIMPETQGNGDGAGPGTAGELLNWTSTIALVFLSGAALNSGMRWCARGTAWDAAGTILSGILAFIVYRLTISDNMLPNVNGRWMASILPVVVWALLLPILMWGFGFRG